MLLAIDLGNTETHVGVWDGSTWCALWRRRSIFAGSDEFAEWLRAHIAESGIEASFGGVICASVVPTATDAIIQAATRVTECVPVRLSADSRLGMEIRYDPPQSLGADRLANALAARYRFTPPVLVVDIGTATTFEAVDRSGAFVGGAIMPGPAMAAAALAHGTAALPEAILKVPPRTIGQTTMHSLQSGIMLGHAAAVQGLATKLTVELGNDTTVIATGGLGEGFLPLCPILGGYYPTLTLDGLVLAFELLAV